MPGTDGRGVGHRCGFIRHCLDVFMQKVQKVNPMHSVSQLKMCLFFLFVCLLFILVFGDKVSFCNPP